MTRENGEDALAKAGVRMTIHRKILLDALPCGIRTAAEALADGTPWQTNAPRAILVCYWKGMVGAFARLEADADRRAGGAR